MDYGIKQNDNTVLEQEIPASSDSEPDQLPVALDGYGGTKGSASQLLRYASMCPFESQIEVTISANTSVRTG